MGKSTFLADGQLDTLDRLKAIAEVEPFYLAGGSAAAYHLGHRRSVDLDLFSTTLAVDLEAVRAALVDSLPGFSVLAQSDAALSARTDATLVDLVRYRYPTLDPPTPGPRDFPVAGLRDLAAMKLAAIGKRGIRRDFWDLYEIVHAGVDLADALRGYLQKFGVAEANLYHVLRALTYFGDAEQEPVFPDGLTRARWDEICAFFVARAPSLVSAISE